MKQISFLTDAQRATMPALSPETVARVRAVHIAEATPDRPARKDRRWICEAAVVAAAAVLIWLALAMFGDPA
jgi:hypothetical protein